MWHDIWHRPVKWTSNEITNDQTKMRRHMIKCFEISPITPFPIYNETSAQYKRPKMTIY